MMDFLGKKYVMTHYENFEEYLAYIGIPYFGRKVASALRPVHTLTRNEDGTYLFNVHSTLFNWDIHFTPGVEYDEKRPDGKTIRAIMTIDGNVVTHVQKHEVGKFAKHIIEYYPDKKIVTTTTEGFDKVVKRHYKLVE